ncbi:MAG: response regulator [Patescibacteria group bacterium]|nr:response regulator [Patescibacteria group bacterium]
MKPAILIIEDNRDNTTLLAWALEDAGYQYFAVDTAEAGLTLLEERPIHLILMDISLPGMDGKEATRRLRQDPRFAAMPIIAVTAHAIAEEEQAILACGVDGIMTKPVNVGDLLELIGSILRKTDAPLEVMA